MKHYFFNLTLSVCAGGLLVASSSFAQSSDDKVSIIDLIQGQKYEEASRAIIAGQADLQALKQNGTDAYTAALDAGQYQLAAQIYKALPRGLHEKFVNQAKEKSENGDFKGRNDFLAWLSSENAPFQTFVTKTGSVQGASETAPRALNFQANALVVPTFTELEGDAKQNSIEIMSFDLDSKKFNFQELKTYTDFTRGDIHLSQMNPERCISCHAGRPNWDPWPLWDGVVGGIDDFLEKPLVKTSWSDYLSREVDLAQIDRQRAIAVDILKHIKNGDTGYAHLKDIETRLDPSKRSNLAAEKKDDPDPRPETSPRPNQMYTRQLVARNFDRIAGEIMETSGYQEIKHAVVAALLGCLSEADETVAVSAKNLEVQANKGPMGNAKDLEQAGVKGPSSAVSFAQLQSLDHIFATDFTKAGGNASRWAMNIKKDPARDEAEPANFGPFAVGKSEEWQLSRVVRHLATHDPELRSAMGDTAETFDCKKNDRLVSLAKAEIAKRLNPSADSSKEDPKAKKSETKTQSH